MTELTVKNGANREFVNSPLTVEWNGGKGTYLLSRGKEEFYGQTVEENGENGLVFITPAIKPGEEVKMAVKNTEKAPAMVKLTDKQSEGTIDIFINEQFFTSYNYSDKNVRPFLFPVVGPEGKSVLRTPASEGNPEKMDHIHHRGIWVSHGDVNGTDNWSEEPGHGRTIHKKFVELVSGPVFGRIHSANDWVSNNNKKILEEERIITVYNLPEENRIIDHKIILRASEGEVVFKDTKESGLLSIRINPVMEERNGGRMVNAYGGRGETECWGKRAEWCDYCGEVEGVMCGISIFDQQKNFRHPTYWHIRSYGLFTANFFGLSDFTANKKITGTYILPAFEELILNYRIYVHRGDTVESRVADRYLNYIYPPQTEIKQ
jgi:hypothetical protein